MTQIAAGRMIIKRIKLKIAPMKGEAIVRDTEQVEQPAPENEAQAKGKST